MATQYYWNDKFDQIIRHETLDNFYTLTRLSAREDLQEFCSRESFKTYMTKIYQTNIKLRDIRFPPLRKWNLRSSGMLLSIRLSYPCFGTTYWPHVQGPSSPIRLHSSWTAWPMKIGRTGCPKTSVINYTSALIHIKQQRMSVDIRNSIVALSTVVVCKTAPLGKTTICYYMFTAAAIGRVWCLYMCISARRSNTESGCALTQEQIYVRQKLYF
jgi:hypothetical protein